MKHFLPIGILALSLHSTPAMAYEPIYDESKVPEYTLPDPLVFEDGSPLESAEDWDRRREELLELFATQVYGRTVIDRPEEMRFTRRKRIDGALEGKAILEEYRILFDGTPDGPFLDLLVLKPREIPTPGLPTILALNFAGNHSVHPSEDITLSDSWMRMKSSDEEEGVVVDHRATEKARGDRSERWPVEMILDSGVALATFYYGDVDPDFDDGFENGIHALTGVPAADEWGSIGAWAWGASRAMDHLALDPAIDPDRVAVMGHSRLGKAALWAGAQDERFSLVISNNSGCGGAALSRRRFGERVSRINESFPHWFCDRFTDYDENESELPVDQHQLITLIAPRMVYVASAEEDRWADPRGEFLATRAASPVWELLGQRGIGVEEMPPNHEPVGDSIRYHIRAGEHAVTDYDWEQYIEAVKASGPK